MTTDKDTVSSYDEHAKEWADRMRNKKNIAHEFLEKPAMYGRLPENLAELDILCAGCGSGEECQALKDRGANRVVGVDISKGLIEQAKYAFPDIEFDTQNIEQLNFPEKSFDIVYASLVMHYLPDWRRALSNVKKVLKDDGKFLLSSHHPIKWGANDEKIGTERKLLMGYSKDNASDENFKIYGDYFTTRLIKDIWFGNMPVNYYHEPLSEIFTEVLESGFEINAFLEPKSIPEAKRVKKDFYEIHQKIPLFFILELTKNV